MTAPHQPQPHTDGWIQHDGKSMPVDGRTPVDVCFNDGWTSEDKPGVSACPAEEWGWTWGSDGSAPGRFDIIAYRLSPSTTQSKDGETGQ